MRTQRNPRRGRIYSTSGWRPSDEAQLGQVRGGLKAAGSRKEGARMWAAGAGTVPDAGAGNGRECCVIGRTQPGSDVIEAALTKARVGCGCTQTGGSGVATQRRPWRGR